MSGNRFCAGRWAALTAMLALAVALGGCGETTGAAVDGGSAARQLDRGTRPRVALHLGTGGFTVERAEVKISGTATPHARVTVDHRRAALRGSHWSRTVDLHLGRNRVSVRASLAGHRSVERTITVTRLPSAAESETKDTREAEAEQPTSQPTAGTSPTECANGTYVNAAGNTVCSPQTSPSAPAGATAECADGSYSFSESRSGTCSHHGGVARWLE